MKIFFSLVLLNIGALAVGCGSSGGDDAKNADGLSGIYPVKSQTKNIAACDVEGAADTSAPSHYRIFSNSEIFPGTTGWSTESCSSLEVCKDESIDFSNLVFDTQTDNGWKGDSVSTATGGANCGIFLTTSEAVKQSDGSLELKIYSYSGTFDFTGEDCKPKSQKVEESKSKLSCTEFKRVLTEVPQ
jgi:hypothetical protein